ncbi:hypothetical protein T492DRAFT_1105806 [Pavlovales sp. CCMP2436]|nr:hypothetical protein T492DRAFT_1105806 [Pavlovales sp. CCMP2436]
MNPMMAAMNPTTMDGTMGQNDGADDASNLMAAQMALVQQMMAANNPMMASESNGGGSDAGAEAGWAAAQPGRRTLVRSAPPNEPSTSGVPACITQQHVQAAALKTMPPRPVQVAGGEYLYPAEHPSHAAATTGSDAADLLALDFGATLGEDESMRKAGKTGGEEGETPLVPDSPRRVTAKAAADADMAAGSGIASHTPGIAAAKQEARPASAPSVASKRQKTEVGSGLAGSSQQQETIYIPTYTYIYIHIHAYTCMYIHVHTYIMLPYILASRTLESYSSLTL